MLYRIGCSKVSSSHQASRLFFFPCWEISPWKTTGISFLFLLLGKDCWLLTVGLFILVYWWMCFTCWSVEIQECPWPLGLLRSMVGGQPQRSGERQYGSNISSRRCLCLVSRSLMHTFTILGVSVKEKVQRKHSRALWGSKDPLPQVCNLCKVHEPAAIMVWYSIGGPCVSWGQVHFQVGVFELSRW